MDFTSTSSINGICTSDVMSEALPTQVITFWKTVVTSLKQAVIRSGDIGCFSCYRIYNDSYRIIYS